MIDANAAISLLAMKGLRHFVAWSILVAMSSPAGAQQRGLSDLGASEPRPTAKGPMVDVELVLAVDVSWSMDEGEQEIQRAGYAAAFRSREVQSAILDGAYGRLLVTYVEWAGAFSQNVIVPWTLIDSKESADAFAYRLASEELSRERRTSIASVIDYGVQLLEHSGSQGLRRVIDISGDGPNNEGRPVTEARDAAIRHGITINGLPLMTSSDRRFSWGSIPHLDRYYLNCVIGGPGAFMIPVNNWDQFPDAVRRKLVMELASNWTSRATTMLDDGPVVLVQGQPAQEDCLVGERMWQQRQRQWMDGQPQ